MTERAVPTGIRLWLLIALPLLIQFVALGLGASLLSTLTGDAPRETTLTYLPQAVLVVLAYVIFGLAIWGVARVLGDPRQILALHRTPLRRAVLLAGGGLIVGIIAAAALEPIFHGSARQPISAGDITTVATMAALVLSIIAIVGGAALTEELYFRGLLYGRLDARLGVASAVVGSAGAFALAHFDPNAFPVLLVLGLILGFVRLRTGSVWPGVGLHAANNVIAVIALLAAR